MAAVQRTPTPIDPRSRMAFIESMEEELKRVQEHLGRRQWKQRNSSTTHSASSTSSSSTSSFRKQQTYYTLARSNPATRRKKLWDPKDEEDSDEAAAALYRANSAQDILLNHHHRRSSISSCSSKSPTSSPEPIRVKSPQRLPPSGGYGKESPFSSPTRRRLSSPMRGRSTSPASCLLQDSPIYFLDDKKDDKVENSLSNATHLAVKEMAYAFRDAVFPDESYDAEEDDQEEEEEEEGGEDERSDTREVMPSALDDLFTATDSETSQYSNQSDQKPTDSNTKTSPIDQISVKKSSDLRSDLISSQGPRPAPVVANGNESTRKPETVTHSISYERSQLDNLKKIKELRLEKEESDKQLSRIIEQLQLQLREKEKDIDSLQTQHLMEIKVREERIKKQSRQNARLEREKWDLLKRAREAAERSVNLRTKLDLQDGSMRSLQVEMDRTRDEMSSVKAANNSLRALVRDLKTKTQKFDVGIQVDISMPHPQMVGMETHQENGQREEPGESDSGNASGGGGTELNILEEWAENMSITSSHYDGRETTPTNSFLERQGKERRSMKNLLKFKFRRSSSTGKQRHSSTSLTRASTSTSSLDNLQLCSQTTLPVTHSVSGLTRSQSPGNTHQRHSTVSLHEQANATHPLPPRSAPSPVAITSPSPPLSQSGGSPDSHVVLKEFQGVSFPQWNTRALVAWIDIVVGMPQYISTIRQHVTSGHAMLALTNGDMEKRLGIGHPLHRRRLRLAIEEQRRPSSPMYPEAAGIDHNWVAYTWAVNCGLPHLSSQLYNGMVNALVLNSLSREDLKKYFKITKKVEQFSFLSGVELLRMHEFNRDSLHMHHLTTDNPLYWNNGDILNWLKKINLEEYSGYVKDSGVHGALLFLERGYFNSEQLANIIHIPAKSPLRKYLATQLAKLFSADELNSAEVNEEIITSQEQLTPAEVAPLSPSSPPLHTMLSSSSEHSPHPSRRLLAVTTSNPNLTEEEQAPPTNFDRNHVGRRSLRESMLRAVQLPVADTSRRQRPVSQLVSTTTV